MSRKDPATPRRLFAASLNIALGTAERTAVARANAKELFDGGKKMLNSSGKQRKRSKGRETALPIQSEPIEGRTNSDIAVELGYLCWQGIDETGAEADVDIDEMGLNGR